MNSLTPILKKNEGQIFNPTKATTKPLQTIPETSRTISKIKIFSEVTIDNMATNVQKIKTR